MLALWSAGREYAVQDLVIFALTAVVGLVVILVVFWFKESQSRVSVLHEPVVWISREHCRKLC